MMQTIRQICFFIGLLAGCFAGQYAFGQTPAAPRPSQAQDTVRTVQIVFARTYRFMTLDSNLQVQVLTGDVQLVQGNTRFRADSVLFNEKENFIEAFGNIHIKEADSINIYAQYLQYQGSKKLAVFKKSVRLTDGNSTLYTDHMEYDLNGKVGTYLNGGRLESKQTTLTSKKGFYYADIKDVYFYEQVKLSHPDYALATDTLLYNTGSEVATFLAPTTIKSGKAIINTREGFYDLKLKKSRLSKRSIVKDSSSVIIADDFAFDDRTGLGEARGNVRFTDTLQKIQLFANTVFFNRTQKSFLATDKPVMLIVQGTDSIYIAADTLFSGLTGQLKKLQNKGYIKAFDTADTATQNAKDAVHAAAAPKNPYRVRLDTTLQVPDTILKDTLSLSLASADTAERKPGSDTLRFITGFRNVRIFNDSLQAVADSMFYSGIDSVFRLFYEPVLWSKENQLSGDTIYLYTRHQKADRLYLFENAILLQQISPAYYNQLKGRVINAYFTDGTLSEVEAKGTAESIYFATDKDSAYIGMNRTEADKIQMLFAKRALQKVKYISSIKSTTYPIRQLPEDKQKLEGFKWLAERRPKDKLALFQ